ncbi:MAG: RNA-binding protein [Candidatus Krumholzibacteria bacterium]|nr:RNA-binding protein [Candidatus Krumholzibacteria bacterium]
MSKKIYVGNLSFDTNDEKLNQLFAAFGQVTSANVIMDRLTGRSRGFGFVEMENNAEADKAIAALNGKDVDGRALKVSEAQPREDKPRGGGGFGGGGGYGGGGGGGRRGGGGGRDRF